MEPEPEPAPVEPPTTDELLAAAVSDPERLAQLLDNASANIDALDDRGYAALHVAVWQGNLAVVETLLEYGADVEATTRTKKRPLYLAVETGNTEIVAALLVHGAVPDADVQGLTALHEAVRRGEVEAARLLLDYGADVNATTYDLREPLFLAVLSRKANVIKLLLDRGAEPDSFFTEDPPTALHLAAHNGDVDAMEALLDGGANVDPRDFEGGTPLFRAVESGHLNAVELLLQRGANTRAWRVDGRTALDLAEGNDDMRELLEAETVWKGPRIGGDDNEDAEEQPEQPFRVLKPSPPPPETDRHKNVACHGFEAIVVDFYTSGTEEEMVPKAPSVYELLYSQGPEAFRSTLQGRTPDFTWYHLPANNLVWAETLVRRIAAEKGGISAEMYDEAKADLDLAKRMPRLRPPQNVPARLLTLRSHSRRVTGPSPISAEGIGDGIVSFVPFLHYDTYLGYSKMAQTMDEITKGKPAKAKKKQKQYNVLLQSPPSPPPPPPPPPARATAQSQRGSGASRQNRPATDGSDLPSSSFASSEVVLDWRTRARLAFQIARGKLSGWLGRKPALPEESILTDTDLEGQPEQAAGNTSVRSTGTRGEAASAPVSEKSIAPQDVSLPPSRQSSGRQRSSHSNEHQTAAELGQDGNVPSNDRTFTYEPAQGSHFETRSRSSRRAPTIPPPKRMERRRTAPPDQNLNEHLIRGYYQPGGIAYQPRRTLDQYGYADIETTSHRDDDQVVYRYTHSEPHSIPKIFMVDQLWIWVLGKDTIITCSPLRWHSWMAKGFRTRGAVPHVPRPTLLKFFGGQSARPPPRMPPAMYMVGAPPAARKARSNPPPRKERLFHPDSEMWPELKQNDPLNVAQRVTRYLSKKSGRGAVTSVHDLASVVATCCVDVFDPHQASDDFLFFDFFERSIGRANDLVASYLRQFKDAISEMRDGQREDIELDITDETTLMIEVEDILDELHTLKKVLEDQERVISDLNKVLEGFAPEGKKPAEVEMRTLKTHLSRIGQMEDAARKADTSLHRLMDLKQKQASLAEAWYARESAKDTARQGKTVIVFTVVTIIFLPISFIAAVFSIDTNGFPLDTNEKIPFNYVMKHILTIGLALSIPLIIIAFNVDRIAELIYTLRNYHEVLWKKGTLGAVVVGIFAAILVPIWTSELSHSGKVATTVVFFLLAFGAVIAYLIRYLFNVATRKLDVTTISSDTSSE